MKNAICMLIFGNDLYVVGACLSAFVHKKFIEKNNLDISLVVMVDNSIIKYKKELEKYFDKVVLIEMLEVNLNKQYYVLEKYSKWMKYSINKWQILKLTDYEKILFIDIDILPITDNFYDVFDNKTPGFIIKGVNTNNEQIKNFGITKDLNFSIEKCYNYSEKFIKSIDAGFVLLNPNIDLYNEYYSFLKKCAGDKGYISLKHSGVDETSILIFYMFYKKIPIYTISYENAVIPWEKHKYNINNIKGINFLAMIKPWVLLPMLQWGEQNIWHKIAKKALDKDSIITELYVSNLLKELKKLIESYDEIVHEKNSPYNLEGIIQHKNLFEKIKEIISDIDIEDLKHDDKKEIMDLTKEIHKFMDKKSIIDMNQIEKIIE